MLINYIPRIGFNSNKSQRRLSIVPNMVQFYHLIVYVRKQTLCLQNETFNTFSSAEVNVDVFLVQY